MTRLDTIVREMLAARQRDLATRTIASRANVLAAHEIIAREQRWARGVEESTGKPPAASVPIWVTADELEALRGLAEFHDINPDIPNPTLLGRPLKVYE